MVPLSFLQRGGKVCGGMGGVRIYASGRGKRGKEWEKRFKIFFFPASMRARA